MIFIANSPKHRQEVRRPLAQDSDLTIPRWRGQGVEIPCSTFFPIAEQGTPINDF